MKNHAINSNHLSCPIYSEGWRYGAYTYSGVYLLDGVGLTPDRHLSDVVCCKALTYGNRKRRFPWFLSRYITIVVYCAPTFEQDAIAGVFGSRAPRGWGHVHAAVFFDSAHSRVIARTAMQNDTILLFSHIDNLMTAGTVSAAASLGKGNKTPQIE